MSLLTDNIIPGNQGMIFSTNAKEESDLAVIKRALLTLDGVEDVQINNTVFPLEFTVFTHSLVSVEDVEKKVNETGFHSIPKNTLNI
ncbi:heavy-metal-associated domain-containing protein [Flavobacterium silvisoli]|uniref:Heavy-metal-associated domain-containing protein n=1 Tax=Flavobacterium silvisoli TaxID=2529433 RepID=A0A4Q9Z2G9_9FLAO|nr:heavy metal-associated domain-containing protein [Flavobacterium silvisoli]TBX70546.1 heavy-metal-associated domain-containing protein [Flavobacterium silvisoli]